MTPIEIVNRALTSLGNLPATSMADLSKNPARAITAYPLCRDEVMRAIAWPSLVTRTLMKNMNEQATPWQASHRYYAGERATNDSAKTYVVTREGTSESSGGPTGTGSGITDPVTVADPDYGVIWAYAETSTAQSNWAHWISTAYVVGDLVIWGDNKVYECVIAGDTGGATPPTGTSKDITDNEVHWSYYGTVAINRTIYSYQSVIPADCLRILKVPSLVAALETQQGIQYKKEGIALYCNQDESFLQYIRQEPDPDQWDELMQNAVTAKIASEIAYDVTAKAQLAQLAFQKFIYAEDQASSIALHEGSEGTPEEIRWEDV